MVIGLYLEEKERICNVVKVELRKGRKKRRNSEENWKKLMSKQW
jgi:hypothetical protein